MDSVRGLANIRRRAIALREQRQRLRERQQEEGVASRGEELGDMELELDEVSYSQWNLIKDDLIMFLAGGECFRRREPF